MPAKQENASPGNVNKVDAVDEIDEFAALLASGNADADVVNLSASPAEPEVMSEIDEFSTFLAGGGVEAESITVAGIQRSPSESEIEAPVVEHISDELIEWAISSRNRSQGVFGVQIEGAKLLALQVPEAFYDYIDSEYSIESTQRDLVLEQLRHDLELSGNVISNVGDSAAFPVYVNGIEVNALIINQVFPRVAVGEVCINKEPA
jgi:hypothetical protein